MRDVSWALVRSRVRDVSRDYAARIAASAVADLELSNLLRCIVGNPFRTVPIEPAVLAWNDGTVPQIAAGIYDERAFDRLPVLADALLDAGCDDEELLDHCRSKEPHGRGCWAIDLLIGKA